MISGMSKLAKSEQHPESCWRTPGWLISRIRQEIMYPIELDPCTDSDNPVCAHVFYTPANDGILQPWYGATIYVNPPYGRTISKWVDKSITAAHQHRRVVLLVPARTDSRWFQSLLSECTDMLLIAGRIKFETPPGYDLVNGGSKFPSAMFGLNISLEPLSDLGTLMVRQK